MTLSTRFRLAGASLALVTAVGVTATACANEGNSSYRDCSYTPVEDGIKVDEDEKTPCVVTDVREADDRKARKTTSPGSIASVPGKKTPSTGSVTRVPKPKKPRTGNRR